MEYVIVVLSILVIVEVVLLLQKERTIKQLRQQLTDSFVKQARSEEQLNGLQHLLELEKQSVRQQREDDAKQKQQMQEGFKIMAHEIIEEKSKKITESNQQNIKQILDPLNERLLEFKKKVEETYDRESKERFTLQSSIKELVQLNQRISQEANNLTRALKGDSKVQGDWGEMILETILKKSGLRKGEEYFTQEYLKDEWNKRLVDEQGKGMRPDVVVVYPDDRKVIIDSKVSLTAYARYSDAEENEPREKALQEHLVSVKQHINELSRKGYDVDDKSIDFVMMFVPNEGAYSLAMQSDADLWNYAYNKRIVLICPTNLITALRLIADLWKREYQNRNAIAIAERGSLLYDKLVVFVEKLSDIGVTLTKAQSQYEETFKTLSTGRGNLLSQAEQLKELGVKSKKKLPTILDSTKEQ